MHKRLTASALIALLVAAAGIWSPGGATETRHSGLVIDVDPAARTLTIDELGAAAVRRTLRVTVSPQASVVVSERQTEFTDFDQVFKDRPISLDDIREGDFVTVVVTSDGDRRVTDKVLVTLRASGS